MRKAGQAYSGKISKAFRVFQTFTEEIEADLHRYYGIDLLDIYRPGGKLSWRKLLVLIEHLPPESAVSTAIRNRTPEEMLRQHAGDPTRATWSGVESLLATLIDEIRQLEWLYASAHTDQKLTKPEPIKRPGVKPSRKLRAISLDVARKLDPRLRNMSDDEARDRMKRLGRG